MLFELNYQLQTDSNIIPSKKTCCKVKSLIYYFEYLTAIHL